MYWDNRYKQIIRDAKLDTVDDFQHTLETLHDIAPTKKDAARVYWTREIHNAIGFIDYPIDKILNNEKGAVHKIYLSLEARYHEAQHYLFMLFKEYLYSHYKDMFSEEVGDIIFDSIYSTANFEGMWDIYRAYHNCAKVAIKILEVKE